MTFQQRQSHLIDQIQHLKDESILIMLEEELSYYLENENTIQLSQADFNELVTLAGEPDEKEIISENEYRKATERWRLK
jgi:hypothetical protein